MTSISLHLPTIPSGRRTSEAAGPLGSLLTFFSRARPSRIDREVAALIEATGGKFTDSLDRAIERRLFDRQ
jgi:hypothetical protein